MKNNYQFRAFQDGEMIYQKGTGVQFLLRFFKMLYYDLEPEKLMQFTGVRDSTRTKEHPNGKPIFTGDIIEYKGDYKRNAQLGTLVKSPFFSREVVSFSDGEFKKTIAKQENSYFGDLPYPVRRLTVIGAKNAVVIGNIFENSELIK